MNKAVITIEEGPNGKVNVLTSFEPELNIKNLDSNPSTHLVAFDMINFAMGTMDGEVTEVNGE